jgi:large subunit ribosomal protein L22
MQIRSIFRGARISAFKCREVTREIQGKPVSAALEILTFTPRKAARLVEKTLKSAIANAENNNKLQAEKLVVQEAVVGEGPTFKRFQPKARGSAGPIRKRTSHIRIILTDEIEIPESRAEKRAAARRRSTAQSSAKKKSKPAPQTTPEPEPAAPEALGAETTSPSQE